MVTRIFYSTLNSAVLTLWGVNILSLISTNLEVSQLWISLDVIPRVWFSCTGALYLTLKAHNYYHSSKLDRKKKRLEIDAYENSLNTK